MVSNPGSRLLEFREPPEDVCGFTEATSNCGRGGAVDWLYAPGTSRLRTANPATLEIATVRKNSVQIAGWNRLIIGILLLRLDGEHAGPVSPQSPRQDPDGSAFHVMELITILNRCHVFADSFIIGPHSVRTTRASKSPSDRVRFDSDLLPLPSAGTRLRSTRRTAL